MTLHVVIDLFILLSLLFAYWLGFRRGAIQELFGAVAIVAAALVSIPTYIKIGIVLQAKSGMPLIVCQLISFIGIFLVIALICRLLAWLLQQKIEKSNYFKSFNKSFGGGLGAIKALVIFLVLAIVLLMVPMAEEYLPPAVRIAKEKSLFLRFASLFVPGVRSMSVEAGPIKIYQKIMKDPEKLTEQLGDSPRFKKFVESDKMKKMFNNTKIQKLLENPKIKKYSQERNYVGLIKEMMNSDSRKIFEDPEFRDSIPQIVSEFEDIILNLTDEVKTTIKGKKLPLGPMQLPRKQQ